jgi:hypothetical protein
VNPNTAPVSKLFSEIVQEQETFIANLIGELTKRNILFFAPKGICAFDPNRQISPIRKLQEIKALMETFLSDPAKKILNINPLTDFSIYEKALEAEAAWSLTQFTPVQNRINVERFTITPLQINAWNHVTVVTLKSEWVTALPSSFLEGSKDTLIKCHLELPLTSLPDDFGTGWKEIRCFSLKKSYLRRLPENFAKEWIKLETASFIANRALDLSSDNFLESCTMLQELNCCDNALDKPLPQNFDANKPHLRQISIAATSMQKGSLRVLAANHPNLQIRPLVGRMKSFPRTEESEKAAEQSLQLLYSKMSLGNRKDAKVQRHQDTYN